MLQHVQKLALAVPGRQMGRAKRRPSQQGRGSPDQVLALDQSDLRSRLGARAAAAIGCKLHCPSAQWCCGRPNPAGGADPQRQPGSACWTAARAGLLDCRRPPARHPAWRQRAGTPQHRCSLRASAHKGSDDGGCRWRCKAAAAAACCPCGRCSSQRRLRVASQQDWAARCSQRRQSPAAGCQLAVSSRLPRSLTAWAGPRQARS